MTRSLVRLTGHCRNSSPEMSMNCRQTRRPRLLQFLQSAAPADRLLRRDTRNYLKQTSNALRNVATRRGGLKLLKRVRLPIGAYWSNICRLKDTVLAAGELNGAVVLLPLRWENGDIKSQPVATPWLGSKINSGNDLLLTCGGK